MKKIFFSLLAIAAIASCAKTEDVFTEGDSEIKLAPVAKLQTKANYLGAVDGTTYPTQENFDVFAYWKNVDAGVSFTDGTMFLEGAEAGGAEFVNKGNYWGGAVNYYWPKNGSLRFAAYSPSHLDAVHTLDGDVFYINGYTQPDLTAETWDFLVAPTSPSYSMMTATEQVAIEFQHALSWITLKVVAKDADAAKAFDIKKVTINDVNTVANFEAAMEDGIQFDEWSKWNTPKPYVVFEGSQMVSQTVTDIENTVAGTLVIPQATTTVTIDFDQYGVNGTADTPGMTVTLDLVLDTDNTPWEPGKHYNYNLIFGLDEILINPSVADWTEVEVGELDVDASNVSTKDQLVAALANGGKVTLQSDIALDANQTLTVPAGKNVVLDLNGFTLSNETTATGNREMFLVKGTLTVNNGTVTTEHTGADLGWTAMTTIFDITAGGAVNLNNVTAKNLGGSAMNFVAHLNNWGKATLNVDNSTLEATYITVRAFNSGNDMNKISIYNTELKGKYCFWVHNYKLAGDNSGTDATLDVDIYNGTNTFSYSGLAPVLYGFNAPLYFDENGNELVFDADGLARALTSTEKNIVVTLAADVDLPITSLGTQTAGSGEYKIAGEETETIVVNLNGYKLNVTTTYWSVLGAKNDNAVITFKNGTMTSSQTSGTWNSYDLCFANCNYVFEDVVFDKAVSLEGKSFDLKNVTINETHDYYAMWIPAKGQVVNVDGLTINSDGRAIKIDEQYVANVGKTVLNISNATFKSAKKAAIVVKSVAGAEINAANLDITAVAADTEFAVWVDEDSKAYADKVVVNGACVKVEGTQGVIVEAGDDFKNTAVEANATVYVAAGTYSFPSSVGAGATILCEDGVVFEGLTKLNINGATVVGATFSNPGGMAVDQTIYGTFKNCTFEGKETLRWCYTSADKPVVFENCVIKTTLRGIHFDGMNGDVTFKNCEINGFNAYSGDATITFEGCTFGSDQSAYNGLNIYSNTVVKDCHFVFDSAKTNFIDMEGTGKTLTITNCTATLDGVDAEVESFVGGSKLAQNTVTVDGVRL